MAKLIITLIEPTVQTVSIEYFQKNDMTVEDIIRDFVGALNAFGYSPDCIREAMLAKAYELEKNQ